MAHLIFKNKSRRLVIFLEESYLPMGYQDSKARNFPNALEFQYPWLTDLKKT